MAANSTDHCLNSPDLRPMLTAMMVYLVGFGLAALIVAVSMWRQTSCSPIPQKSRQLYMVLAAPGFADRSARPAHSTRSIADNRTFRSFLVLTGYRS
jgi:hypothetical protein